MTLPANVHLNYRAIVEARGTFHDAQQALALAVRHVDEPDVVRAAYLGRCAEACDNVEEAIFRALNVLSSFLGDEEAARVVHHREWQPAEVAEVAG